MWQYQESVEYGYEDEYYPVYSSGNEFHAVLGADALHRPRLPSGLRPLGPHLPRG